MVANVLPNCNHAADEFPEVLSRDSGRTLVSRFRALSWGCSRDGKAPPRTWYTDFR